MNNEIFEFGDIEECAVCKTTQKTIHICKDCIKKARADGVKSQLKILQRAENRLDLINGKYGSLKTGFCLDCKSVEWSMVLKDGQIGIIHKDSCLIKSLRDRIEKLKSGTLLEKEDETKNV